MLFISYPRELTERCLALRAELARRRIRVWVDLRQMQGGPFPNQLRSAIERSGAVVLLLSPEAATSEWVEAEAMTALDTGKLLIPVLVKEIPIPRPEWVDAVLQHHGIQYYPADPHVVADKIRDLLPRHYWIRQLRPSKAQLAVVVVASLAAIILLLPLSLFGSLASNLARTPTRIVTVSRQAGFDLGGATLVPHGDSSVGTGQWHFAFDIPDNPAKARRNKGRPGKEFQANAARAELKPTLRANLRLSATVDPGANIKSIDLRGCDLAVIFDVSHRLVRF